MKDYLDKKQKIAENDSKHLKIYYYNDVRLLANIRENLIKPYEKENNAFKLLFCLVMRRKNPSTMVTN